MALATGLAAYYKLDEVSGQRNDSVGTNHLTDNNTVTSNTGKIGLAAEMLHANSEYLSAAHNAAFVFTTAMSLSYWVFPTDQALGELVHVGKWVFNSDGGWLIENPGSNAILAFIATTQTDAGTGCRMAFNDAACNNGVWTHAVMVFDGTLTGDANRLKVYTNGVLRTLSVGAGAVPATLLNPTTAALRIGDCQGLNRFFSGRLDEVGLWNRALTTAEVTQLYNGGAGMSYDQIVPPAGQSDLNSFRRRRRIYRERRHIYA